MGKSEFDALLFDFDGVILESTDIKTAAFVALYAEYGPHVAESVRSYHLAHGGVSRFEKFRYFDTELLGRPTPSAARERELGERFVALAFEAVLAAPLVAGIAAVLAYYRTRVPMYVISGTPQDELEQIVAARGLLPDFIEVRGSPIDKATHIAAVLAAHGHRAAHVLMLGDALTDYEAARANGTLFLGRVAPGSDNPFPTGVPAVADFNAFAGGSLETVIPAQGRR